MTTDQIIELVLVVLLAGSEYLGSTDKFKANGWLQVIGFIVTAIKAKVTADASAKK